MLVTQGRIGNTSSRDACSKTHAADGRAFDFRARIGRSDASSLFLRRCGQQVLLVVGYGSETASQRQTEADMNRQAWTMPQFRRFCKGHLGVEEGPIDFCLGRAVHRDQTRDVSVVL